MGEWLLSRRDGAIVAWHEVPGTASPKKPSRRVRSDGLIRAGVRTDSIGSDEISRDWLVQSFHGAMTHFPIAGLDPLPGYPLLQKKCSSIGSPPGLQLQEPLILQR